MAKISRCLLLCKDKNFKANHNEQNTCNQSMFDVCYSAKIRILKQITTGKVLQRNTKRMFVTLQR